MKNTSFPESLPSIDICKCRYAKLEFVKKNSKLSELKNVSKKGQNIIHFQLLVTDLKKKQSFEI